MAKALLFEHRSCPRCGGSGSYSYCSMYGSRCFKCAGVGNVLTKRGRAAQDFYNTLKTKPAGEFKVGDKFFEEGFSAGSFAEPNRWVTIESIEPDALFPDKNLLVFRGVDEKRNERCSRHGLSPDSPVRYCRTNEEVAEHKRLALEYQATLTKSGTPMKRRAA